MACTADSEGNNTFAIHLNQLIASNGGRMKLPHSMRKVLTHPAAIFINANQHNDLDAVINAFYGGRLDGVKFVEAHQLFRSEWGEKWDGLDPQGKARSTSGFLRIFEYAFRAEKLTWKKKNI